MIYRFGAPEAVYRAVEDMAWWVTLDLGLREAGDPLPIPIAFWKRERIADVVRRQGGQGKGTIGLYWPDEDRITICDDLTPREAATVTAHELRHAWQYRHWNAVSIAETSAIERDARAYERQAVGRFYQAEHREKPATIWSRVCDWMVAAPQIVNLIP
ncbi:MAG: DUF6782 family putative metallopeptidase [Rhodothermales bacterium]